jgi:hypothetical protein
MKIEHSALGQEPVKLSASIGEEKLILEKELTLSDGTFKMRFSYRPYVEIIELSKQVGKSYTNEGLIMEVNKSPVQSINGETSECIWRRKTAPQSPNLPKTDWFWSADLIATKDKNELLLARSTGSLFSCFRIAVSGNPGDNVYKNYVNQRLELGTGKPPLVEVLEIERLVPPLEVTVPIGDEIKVRKISLGVKDDGFTVSTQVSDEKPLIFHYITSRREWSVEKPTKPK